MWRYFGRGSLTTVPYTRLAQDQASGRAASSNQAAGGRRWPRPADDFAEGTPSKSRSPYTGRASMAGVAVNRTRRHWNLCATIRAMEEDSHHEEWADRLILDMEPMDDMEATWRAAYSPEDCLELVERARKMVDVTTPPKQLALPSSPALSVGISPNLPMDAPAQNV